MVTTFELVRGQLERLGDAPGMHAASAQLPQGAYTTFRTYSGDRVLRLSQHACRLQESAALMGTPGALDVVAVRGGLFAALRATRFPESRFRLTFAPPRFFISLEPFTPYPDELYEGGVWCVTLTLHRNNPHAKSTAFIASAGDAYKALPPGAHEGLMVAEDGAVLEGLSSNFFALLDGALHTEQARALVGVTQSLVLEVARSAAPGVAVSTRAVLTTDLARLSECFITSVSREILPVVKIDDRVIGAGAPGSTTRQLMGGFRELIEREAQPLSA